jgi:hypothetical protein
MEVSGRSRRFSELIHRSPIATIAQSTGGVILTGFSHFFVSFVPFVFKKLF